MLPGAAEAPPEGGGRRVASSASATPAKVVTPVRCRSRRVTDPVCPQRLVPIVLSGAASRYGLGHEAEHTCHIKLGLRQRS